MLFAANTFLFVHLPSFQPLDDHNVIVSEYGRRKATSDLSTWLFTSSIWHCA